MTSSNGNIFRVTGHLCGEFTGPRWIPTQRPMTRSFDVFFDVRLNKRLSKQSWGWWFETLSRSLWRHRNVVPWPLASLSEAMILPVQASGPLSPIRKYFNYLRHLRVEKWEKLQIYFFCVFPKRNSARLARVDQPLLQNVYRRYVARGKLDHRCACTFSVIWPLIHFG